MRVRAAAPCRGAERANGVHWRDGTYDMSEESGLTEAQKAIVAPPTVYYTPPWFQLDIPQPRL